MSASLPIPSVTDPVKVIETPTGFNNPNAKVPSFWSDTADVLARVLAIAEYDPQSAGEIWKEYKRLTGK